MTDFLLKSTSARNVRVGDTIRAQVDDDVYEYMLVISREELPPSTTTDKPRVRFKLRTAQGLVHTQTVFDDSPAFVNIPMAPAELNIIEIPRTGLVFAKGSIRGITGLMADPHDGHVYTFEVIGVGFRQLVIATFKPDYGDFRRTQEERDAQIKAATDWLRTTSSEWYEECKRVIFG